MQLEFDNRRVEFMDFENPPEEYAQEERIFHQILLLSNHPSPHTYRYID